MTKLSRRWIILGCALFVLSSHRIALASPIHDAVKQNDLFQVKLLLHEQPSLVSAKDADGFTPLHLAAANGFMDIAELLIACKADVNAVDNIGSTPLHQIAAGKNHPEIAELLLSHGSNKDARDNNGLTPLHYAAISDNQSVLEVLLQHHADTGSRDHVEGNTPLIIAAGTGHLDDVKLLIKYGANINAADKRGTPLAWAIHTNHPDVATFLRANGAHE